MKHHPGSSSPCSIVEEDESKFDTNAVSGQTLELVICNVVRLIAMLLIMGELILSIHDAESIATDCHQHVIDSATYMKFTLYLVICVCLVKVCDGERQCVRNECCS